MSAPQRALVQRPQRRLHLATLVDGAWLTVCDRDLPLAGTAAVPHLWHVALTDEQIAGTCRRCLGPILAARLAIIESGPVLLAENADLRAEVGRLRSALTSALDAAKAYSDRLLAHACRTLTLTDASRMLSEQRREQRTERLLQEVGR